MWRAAAARARRALPRDPRSTSAATAAPRRRPARTRCADLADDVVELLDDLELAGSAWCGLSLGGDGRHVPRLGAPAPARPASRSAAPRALPRPDAVGRADRRRRRRTARPAIADPVVSRWFTPEWAAAHPDVVAELRDEVAGHVRRRATPAAAGPSPPGTTARGSPPSPCPRSSIGGADDLSTPVDPHALTLAGEHPRRPAGGAARRPPRHDRERRGGRQADFGARRSHNFITTPD